MKPRSPHERLRVAVLLDHLNYFSGGFEAQLRDALHANSRAAGHHLLLLYGGLLEPPEPMSVPDNTFYALLRPDSVDGIIVVSSLLSAYCGPDGISRLVERYRPAKLCSIGVALPGVPSIVLDNQPGMEAVVEHLIRFHGCRRLAFLEGTPQNPEADVRRHAYQTVLERNGIAFDPKLVARGYFRTNLAKVAMEEILGRGVGIDGVVAANDEMAVGAIEVLRRHGRVPGDFPVTGFDDILLARVTRPALTTVAQPFDRIVDLAIRILTDQLAGREVAACTQVSAKFICRQSCGCGADAHRQKLEGALSGEAAGPRSLDEEIQALEPELSGVLRTASSAAFAPASHLIDGLRREARGEAESLQHAVADVLAKVGDNSECHHMLQSAIGYLRAGLLPLAPSQLESAFYDSLNLVLLSNLTEQLRHRLQQDENYLRVLTVGEQASIAIDLGSLRDALVHGLPSAGVRTAFLSCVSEGDASQLVPTMCLRDGELLELDEVSFPPGSLLPPRVFEGDQSRTLLVLPLAFDSELLGVIAFNYSEGPNVYTAFRNEIATALKSVRLRQKLVQETMLRERSVQERLATTRRMEALSVLAGGVAHDLNNALGPLVAMSDVILDEINELHADEVAIQELRTDVKIIKEASLRAAQTIKDLLTLGRQGRTLKEDVDLNLVVQSCLADRSPRLAQQGGGAKVSVEATPLPLVIRGSESQLVRAVGNLVRNAVEAVAAGGQVVIKTFKVHLTTAMVGYETIPPGHYAVLAVSDDGCGIAPHDLSRVFEPFFTKKRPAESSGSGLGLAVVHGVVKEHEGFIDVNSTLDVGTTIAIYLPGVVGSSSEQEHAVAPPHGNARILLVDDEPIQLRMGRRVLVRLGYKVDVLESGSRAYELFSRAAPSGKSPCDLLIIDMMLGEALDGLQIFERVQLLFPAQKAVLTSGYGPTERAQLALKKGLPWLAKPYSVEGVARAVQHALRKVPDAK